MAFKWKDKKDIWKGEGIYFVTFAVTGRQRLLGTLVRILEDQSYALARHSDLLEPKQLVGRWDVEKYGEHSATVRKSQLGFLIANDLQNITERHPGYELCGKMIMENHLHVVIWVHDDGGKSIKQWAHGFRMGITQLAREKGLWPVAPGGGGGVSQVNGCVHNMHLTMNGRGGTCEMNGGGGTCEMDGRGGTCEMDGKAGTDDMHEGGLLLEKAFIRTLSHSGQLKNMLAYTHNNPDNLLLMVDNPELYTIRRNQEYAGLHFDCMGKARLLYYPEKNVVALSRSLTKEQIAEEVQMALRRAERGAVTYCAAINDGEKTVTKAIRAAGYPLVVMMLGGFPPEGSETARFFHPGGAYHKACGEGLLYLMAPLAENYNSPRLIDRTEDELKRKAEEKGKHYDGIPHDSTRWRMIAGNEMLRMIATNDCQSIRQGCRG